MKRREYLELLEPIIEEYAKHDYAYWKDQINNEPITFHSKTDDGRMYQIEIEAFWDDSYNGQIRIAFCIDDGGWGAYVPFSQSLLLSPNGSYE